MTGPATEGGAEATQVKPAVGYQADPAIANFATAMSAVEADFMRLVQPLTDQQVNWRPSDGRWSIAECMAHLVATARAYVGPVDLAVERGFSRGLLGGREYHPGWLGRWLIAHMEPPPRRRMSAPGKIVPRTFESVVSLRRDYEEAHRDLVGAASRAAGLDLARVKLSSPLMPLLRQPLGTWLLFLAAHERRHLWQARQVRQEPGFPI